jgi:peroxiredoxin
MTRVPEVSFRDRRPCYNGDYDWYNLTTSEIFDQKRVIVFALPGAFTPTCSTFQLPGYDLRYDEIKSYNIDEVYCLSVNDSFVMNAWFKSQSVQNVKPIPDGNGEFTYAMGMSVSKSNLGFGFRSWRYAMVVNDGEIEQMFEEPGKIGNCPVDPYEVSNPETVLNYLRNNYSKEN